MATSLVITSIAAPNQVMASFSEGCREHDIDFIVIGDTRSPLEFSLTGCDYWSIDRQQELDLKLAKIIPERHYARKNLGYLIAMQRGAGIILETDDDNHPRPGFWEPRTLIRHVPVVLDIDCAWVNVYNYFTSAFIWPRGYPLQHLRQQAPPLDSFPPRNAECPIQQGLADDNPDVDAIFRLVCQLPQRFDTAPELALESNTWTPFNSQNTTWFRDAFPLMYLPSCCSFRMTDIWRSFVAQRICWANGWHVLFHGPTVWQVRNEHDLLKDLSGEMVGYLNNALLCEQLSRLEILPGVGNLSVNLLNCYKALINLGLIGSEELNYLTAWLEDLESIRAHSGQR